MDQRDPRNADYPAAMQHVPSHAHTGQLTGSLPNVLIIGALRAGTTSLHAYLDLHPEIQMSTPKELNYFSGPGSNWDRGPSWYAAHFAEPVPFRGESSTSYTFHPVIPGVPERIHNAIPEVRLIYCVRDPLERFVSHYMLLRAEGRERRSLDTVLNAPDLENSRYIIRSRYWSQLEQYLQYFPANQIIVVSLDELKQRRLKTLGRIFRFLGVNDRFNSEEWSRVYNKARRYPLLQALGRTLPEERLMRLKRVRGVERSLLAFSRPAARPHVRGNLRNRVAMLMKAEVEALRAFTGQSFERWCV
jgi:hypothetical protein